MRLDAEAAQAHLAALAQVLRAADGLPLPRAGAGEAGLGRDGHRVVGVQRLADEVLGDERPVGVGGVDEVDAELGQRPQDRERGVVVGRRAPDALAGDAHRAEAEAGDLEVAADLEGAGCRCGGHATAPTRMVARATSRLRGPAGTGRAPTG